MAEQLGPRAAGGDPEPQALPRVNLDTGAAVPCLGKCASDLWPLGRKGWVG